MRRFIGACTGMLLLSGMIGAMPAAADGNGAKRPPTFTVVADNLNSPRQIVTLGPAVAVAEAGTGGDPSTCAPGAPCVGLTGSVTAVLGNVTERVQTGLLSVSSPGEGGGPDEVTGVDALAITGPRWGALARHQPAQAVRDRHRHLRPAPGHPRGDPGAGGQGPATVRR